MHKSLERREGQKNKYITSTHLLPKRTMGKKKETAKLLHELQQYDKCGLKLYLQGKLSTPRAIVKAHKVAETGSYMRDYIKNEEGEVKKISFDLIKKR